MRKRVFQTMTLVLAAAAVAAGSYLAINEAGQRSRSSSQRQSRRAAQRRQRTTRGVNASMPVRAADPNRAPQRLVDEALYTNEEFFGANASAARPFAEGLARLSTVIDKYPKDAWIRLYASRLAELVGQYDRASTEMVAYVNLKNRSSDSLRRLGDYYHNRAMFADEVRTLQELAKTLNVTERAPIYRRAAKVVRTHVLKEFNPADFFAELVAADQSNIQPIKDYVQELRLAKRTKEALAVLDQYQPKFPQDLAYFLKTRSQISESAGDRKSAERVYDSAFEPTWPRALAADYYELLRRFGRYRVVRRSLQERVRAGATDLDTVSRLFSVFSYEGNYQQAARVLEGLETRRGGGGDSQPVGASRWNAKELETAAAMFASIGFYDQASRYLYTLYLSGGLQPGTEPRENALYRLFEVMLDAAGSPTRVAAGDLSFYRDVAEIDQHPGFLNGVLSLILSGSDIPQEFESEEKAAAGYFNRAFSYRIFTAFKQEYPESRHLGDMYLGVVNVFSSLGEFRLAIEAGREFEDRFPDSPRYAQVALRIADSFVALKDRAGEHKVLAALLDKLAASNPAGVPLVPISGKRIRYGSTPEINHLIDRIKYNIEAYSDTYDPTEGAAAGAVTRDDQNEDSDSDSEGASASDESEAENYGESSPPRYNAVLERYVSSLAADDKKTQTVTLFWGEIKKHPKEEGLYERFLQWLGSAQLINEQLKAYDAAVREFDSDTWYNRLARWYVRQRRGRELNTYAKKLIDVFDEDEVAGYLIRFGGYGSTAKGDGVNWDERFAFDLFGYAHNRFPRNMFFVRGMLTYLAKNDRVRWEKLSAEYYFADRSIRDPYLEWLSKKGELRDRYRQANERRGQPGAPGARVTASASPTATVSLYEMFAADAALWLSHHDEALDAYRRLAALYPGADEFSERLADLTRSFGQTSDKLFEESAGLYSQLAEIYAVDHDYRIKAGEVYAQLGDFKRAGAEWDKLIKLEPGERNTYLEVATVYWDYYQYDQALRVFRQLRDETGDQTIYAYRMGAVYEGKGDMDSAIAEYVKVLSEPGEGRDTVSKRLAVLSKRAGLSEKIAAAYEKARAASPADWQLIIGYATYQAGRQHQADALAMLRTEVSRSTDVGFLETTRDLFRAILRPEDEQQVITRLTAVARDEREAMMYRLQLASFLERNNKVDAAISEIDKLAGDFPTNVGVIEESSQFYWRAGLLDQALDLTKRTIARAAGTSRRHFTLRLARMQAEANKLADAESTLRAFYDQNRADTVAFGELARVLGAENKLDDLAKLYQDAFKDARESGVGVDERRARVVELRLGMIKTLDALGKYDAAVDQYIEIINAYPEDDDRLRSALEHAEQHGLTQRFVAYYEKLVKDSYKNYRWQLVLGRIYERQGNLSGAAEQYNLAVVNEPQRPDLRFNLASVLTRQRRYDEAIAVLRDGWTLAGRDPVWLIEVAQIQVRQGLRDEAVKTVREAMASKRNANSSARLSMAGRLASWGINDEAVRIYEETFNALPKTLKDEYVGSGEVSGYVRALVKTEPAARAHEKIERLRDIFQAIGQNSQDTDGYKAKSIVSAIDAALRADFGRGVLEYATANESAEFVSAIQAAVAKLTSDSDAETLRRYLGIARGAELVDLEEQILTRLKDAAYDARPKNSPAVTPQDNRYYGELTSLVQFYERHVRYDRAAEVLSAEQRRDPYKNRFAYDNRIADEYRLAGDTQLELEALRRAYASASGDLSVSQIDWVERYLSLLHAGGARGELQRLASLYSPYQLQLISFLIDKKEQLLALDAVERAHQSPAWVASRSAEIGLFLKDRSPEVEPLFLKALGWNPIGQMLGRRSPAGRELLGDDWFVASRNYGYWLGMVGREKDSRKFVVGEIEGHPASTRAQIELAAYYLERKDTGRAGAHLQLAVEREPGAVAVKVLRGRIALASKDRKGAIEAWNSIISSASTTGEAQSYLTVMADNGFLREALPLLGDFIVGYVNRAYRSSSSNSQVENIKPLVRAIAERARSDSKLKGEVATFFATILNNMPADTIIARMLIDDKLLSDTALSSVYRTAHQRLSNAAAAVFGTQQYDDGYYNGSNWVYPAKELADFRKQFLDYLIGQRSFDEARLLIATINREQSDQRLNRESHGAEEEPSEYDQRYDWVPLASALVGLRAAGDASKAIAELRRYCGLEDRQQAGESTSENRTQARCLRAYALLRAEHRDSDAEALIYDWYRAVVRSRGANDASFAGLAEVEARRGNADEAARLLRLMAERSTDNARALQLAAETSARIGRYADAIGYREQLTQAAPDDAANKIEMARVMAASGRAADGIERLVSLIGDKAAGNSLHAQAAEVIGEMVRGDRSLATRASELLANRDGSGAVLALAAVREAAGDAGGAREALNRISGGSLAAIAQIKIGMLALAEHSDSEAVAAFEKALRLDSDGRVADAISFRGPLPRAQLVILYGRVGRDAAAIDLAQGDDSQRDSTVSSIVRRALENRGGEQQTPAEVAFEPSLDAVRPKTVGLMTLAELGQTVAATARGELLASIAESAVKLNQYDRAIAIERLRAEEAARAEERAGIEKRLEEIASAAQARTLRLAAQVRFDRRGATQSIYAAGVLGN